MRHFTSRSFWRLYQSLPRNVQELADKQYKLLKAGSETLFFALEEGRKYWSARVGIYDAEA